MPEQRYTFGLPDEVYEELRAQAEKHGISLKEVVRQALKFGLVAMKLEEDPNVDLYVREKIQNGDSGRVEIKESLLKFIW